MRRTSAKGEGKRRKRGEWERTEKGVRVCSVIRPISVFHFSRSCVSYPHPPLPSTCCCNKLKFPFILIYTYLPCREMKHHCPWKCVPIVSTKFFSQCHLNGMAAVYEYANIGTYKRTFRYGLCMYVCMYVHMFAKTRMTNTKWNAKRGVEIPFIIPNSLFRIIKRFYTFPSYLKIGILECVFVTVCFISDDRQTTRR